MAGHMAPKHKKSDGGGGGLRRSGDDALKLTVDYFKQEALDPLKGLGRFLLWGLTGSLAIAVGILLVLVGILRLLQTETGTALTGEDLQAAYSQVLGDGEATVRAAAPQALAVGGAVGLVVITLAFLAGRRRGRSRSAVVEIRRL